MVQNGILLVATLVILTNFVVDMLYGVANPRIRHQNWEARMLHREPRRGRSSRMYPSPLKEFWQAFSRNKGAVAGLVFMADRGFLCGLCTLGRAAQPHRAVPRQFPAAAAWLDGGSSQFLLGTDELGRDLLSRLIHGARLSLLVGLMSVVMALMPGVILGLVAGVCRQVDRTRFDHAPDGHRDGLAFAADGGGDHGHPRPRPDQRHDRHRAGFAAGLRATGARFGHERAASAIT